jgi:exonuclease-1
MGISGLLQLLKSAVCDSQIAEFKYKRVAVDGYSWIHKGVYSCCEDLARGKSSDKWIYFCLKRLDYLLDHHIVVYMVLVNYIEYFTISNRIRMLNVGI